MRQHKQHGRFLFWLLGGVLAAMLVVLLLAVLAHLRSKLIVQRELAALRANQEPTSVAELNGFYDRLVQADPAAPPLDRARAWRAAIRFVRTQEFREGSADLPLLGNGPSIPRPAEDWAELPRVQAWLERYRDPLEVLHRSAAQLGPVRYPGDFAHLFETLPEHLNTVRAVARLLALEAHLAAHQRDSEGFVRAVTAILRVSDSLALEPIGIAMLVRLAIEGTALNVLEQNLQDVSLTPPQAQRLAAALDNRRHVEPLRLALVGERALAIPVFLNFRALAPAAPKNLPARYGDLKYYLEITQRMISACEGDLSDTWKRIHQLQTELDATHAGNSKVTQLLRALTLTSLPSYEVYVKATMRVAFQCDAGRIALALELYRTDHTDYPRTLSELTPQYLTELPSDPYGDQPLRYRRTTDGYLIYSVGPDGRDDQGRMNPDRMEPDIVFQVPAAIVPERQ